MNFDLSDDQRALIDSVEKFARGAPSRPKGAESFDQVRDWANAHWRQMVDLGLAALLVDEDAGGLGMGALEAALVAEALGQAMAQEPFITAGVVAPNLLDQSVDAIRVPSLQAIAEGTMHVAPALQENALDFDLTSVATTCVAGGGRLQLSGRKELVVDGAVATHFAVTARSQDQDINLFLVSADQPGVTVTPVRGLDGGWLARVSFENAAVEGDTPLFASGTALAAVERALDFGYLALSAEALGLMNRVLTLTASYLAARQQFGKPIGTFQALQHRFAEMVVVAEQSRSLIFMAAAALSGDDAAARQRDVSAAKSSVNRHGRAVTEAAIQLHGGIGITDEYELSRYVRRMIEIGKTWGDTQYHDARFSQFSD